MNNLLKETPQEVGVWQIGFSGVLGIINGVERSKGAVRVSMNAMIVEEDSASIERRVDSYI